MEWMTTALTTCTELFSTILTLVTDNPVMAVVFVGGTVVPVGFAIFRQAKRSAKG